MSNICKIDASQIDDILNNLNEENRKKAMINSLVKGAEVLQSETINKLRQKVTNSSSMEWGVKVGKDKDYLEAWVSILKDFRLKWFEMGTDERYRKVRGINDKGKKYVKKDVKGGYTGRMTATHFFAEARENTAPIESAIIEAMEAELNKLMK